MKTVEFNIKVTNIGSDLAQVEMVTLDNVTLREINLTAQYMMWMYAKESGLPFEEALRSLCDGARTFKGVRKIQVLPGSKGKEQ